MEEVKKQAEQAEKGKWGETPVKLANIMQRSKEDSPEMLLLKEVVAGIAELRARSAGFTQFQFNDAGMPIFQSGRFVNLSALAGLNAAPFYGEGGATISRGTIFETPFVARSSETLVAKTGAQSAQPTLVEPQQQGHPASLSQKVRADRIRRIKEVKKQSET